MPPAPSTRTLRCRWSRPRCGGQRSGMRSRGRRATTRDWPPARPARARPRPCRRRSRAQIPGRSPRANAMRRASGDQANPLTSGVRGEQPSDIGAVRVHDVQLAAPTPEREVAAVWRPREIAVLVALRSDARQTRPVRVHDVDTCAIPAFRVGGRTHERDPPPGRRPAWRDVVHAAGRRDLLRTAAVRPEDVEGVDVGDVGVPGEHEPLPTRRPLRRKLVAAVGGERLQAPTIGADRVEIAVPVRTGELGARLLTKTISPLRPGKVAPALGAAGALAPTAAVAPITTRAAASSRIVPPIDRPRQPTPRLLAPHDRGGMVS